MAPGSCGTNVIGQALISSLASSALLREELLALADLREQAHVSQERLAAPGVGPSFEGILPAHSFTC